MFELSVALKYLVPRWRQLSVSIISLVSILVIALVVWLILVFFSVTTGLESRWTQKLIALTAPVRITPTKEYYHSYYYLIDSISSASDYTLKSIDEKLRTKKSDPYDPELDEEIPSSWPPPDRNPDGELKDPVKAVWSSVDNIKGVKGLVAKPFEMTVGTLNLHLIRPTFSDYSSTPKTHELALSEGAYIG